MGLKEKFEKFRKKREAKKSRESQVKRVEAEAFQKARLVEAKRFGTQRAAIERKARVEKFKKRVGSGGGGGFLGGLADRVNIAAKNLGYDKQRGVQSVVKKTTKKRKRKRGRSGKRKGRGFQVI